MSYLYLRASVRVPRASLPPTWLPPRRRQYLLREDIAAPLSVDSAVWPLLEPRFECESWEPPESLTVPAGGERVVVGIAPESAGEKEDIYVRLATDVSLEPKATWTFLGHDIADAGAAPSGLCNCGYDENDASTAMLRATWAPRLNTHGLFDDLADAFAFRAAANARVPEHAPFSVVGLWGA